MVVVKSAPPSPRAPERTAVPAWTFAPHWMRRVRSRVALADAIAVYAAVFVAFHLRWGSGDSGQFDGDELRSTHAVTSMVLVAGWLAALWLAGSLSVPGMGVGSQEFIRVTAVTLAVFGVVGVTAYLSRWDLGRSYVAVALPLGLVLVNVARYVMRLVLVAERASGRHMSRAIAVGDHGPVEHLIGELRRAPQTGIEIVAVCVSSAGRSPVAASIAEVPVVGDVSHAAAFVANHSVDAVVAAGGAELTPAMLKRLAWDIEPHGADLMVAPGLTDVAVPRIQVRPLPGMPLVQVKAPGYTMPHRRLKRVFDVIGALGLIAVFAPLLVGTAVAIRLTSTGPALFRQTRIGVAGVPFQVLKFRSMVVDAESRLRDVLGGEAGIYYKPKDDPRVTRVGAFIRRYSIDELPQLFNVLGGSMSLVGPRPQVPHEVAQYDDAAGRRLLVKPGMTGLWQVSGRSNLTLEQSMRLDLYYVENWSMTGDLIILARTLKAVIARDGAY